MATYISTIKFTDQGLREIGGTTKRAASLKTTAKKLGAKVKEVYWTSGSFDGVLIFDAPDDHTAAALMLHVGSQGNVQASTSRAFNAAEMEQVLAKMSG